MNIDDLTDLVSKICGPILIIGSPIMIGLVIYASKSEEFKNPPTPSDTLWAFAFAIGFFFFGVYMCGRVYGWFRRK